MNNTTYKPLICITVPASLWNELDKIRGSVSSIDDYYVFVVPVSDKKHKDVEIKCLNPIFIDDKSEYTNITDKVNEINKLLQNELKRVKDTSI